MKIEKTATGIYAVFENETAAAKWYFLFGVILRRDWVSFGNFFNAYKIK